jgi:hypothetical protein
MFSASLPNALQLCHVVFFLSSLPDVTATLNSMTAICDAVYRISGGVPMFPVITIWLAICFPFL